jgi:hypothetical protein
MSITRFALFFVLWILACAFFVEPTLIAPLFESKHTVDLAYNGALVQLAPMENNSGYDVAVESMDHFRVLCLLYVGLPLLVYLGSQLKEL